MPLIQFWKPYLIFLFLFTILCYILLVYRLNFELYSLKFEVVIWQSDTFRRYWYFCTVWESELEYPTNLLFSIWNISHESKQWTAVWGRSVLCGLLAHGVITLKSYNSKTGLSSSFYSSALLQVKWQPTVTRGYFCWSTIISLVINCFDSMHVTLGHVYFSEHL